MSHQTFFKESGPPSKVQRFKRRMEAKAKEDAQKAAVRTRDKHCRFPLCGCRKFKFPLEVSHKFHKGMGGDSGGDRSDASLLVYLCRARHRENRISIDRGTLRWQALTEKGAAGPIEWLFRPYVVFVPDFDPPLGLEWMCLAKEVRRGQLAHLEAWQKLVLGQLARMEQ